LVDERPVEFVLTDRRSTEIIQFCRNRTIPVLTGNPRNGRARTFLGNLPVEVIVSVNYLFLVEQDVIDHASRLAFNLHGSLLPKYRGRTPHVWAIIHGEKQVGVTAHEMVQACDAGNIIRQTCIPVNDDDTGGSVLAKYKSVYHPLIRSVLQQVETGAWIGRVQDESQATWFGKRTADDGQIDWSWNADRVRNWVRAQADPYPGAFTWCQGQKIVIDQVSGSDFVFDDDVPMGSLGPLHPGSGLPLVKVADGAVQIDRLREEESMPNPLRSLIQSGRNVRHDAATLKFESNHFRLRPTGAPTQNESGPGPIGTFQATVSQISSSTAR